MRISDYWGWIWQDVRWSPWFAVLNVIGVGANVTVVLVFLALTAGVQQVVVDRITAEVDLLTLEIPVPLSGVDARALLAEHQFAPGVQAAFPVRGLYLYIASGGGEGPFLVYLEDLHPRDGGRDPRLAGATVVGGVAGPDHAGDEILISQALAERLGIDGDNPGEAALRLVVARASGDSLVATVRAGAVLRRTPHDGAVVYGSQPLVSALKEFHSGGSGAYDRVDFLMGELGTLEALRARLREDGVKSRSVLDRVDQVKKVILFVRIVFLLIISIGVMIAVFNLLITLTSYVLRRRKEVGVLTVLGATQQQIRNIFLLHAAFVGAAGFVLGLLAALGLIEMLQALLPHLDTLERYSNLFLLTSSDVVLVAVVALCVSVLGAVGPARAALGMSPAQALRTG
jgi:ABC-type lipoprotein release transport system permease subunit